MCPFVCLLLFISTTGNLLSEVRGDCGGKADVHGERSGSILFSFPAALNNLTDDGTLNNGIGKWSNFTCVWIINAQDKQAVWIDVVHVDEDTSLWIKFSNKTVAEEQGKSTLITGTGRTTVEWSWRNGTNAPRKLHLRWNTSEDGHDLAHVPYTHSDNNPVSPSPDTPNRVTHAADILGFGSMSPSERAFQGSVNVQQGGGVSGSDDKDGPSIPQEGTHNGQETPGTAIFDLAHSVTHSRTDTHTQSSLSYTHAKSHTVTRTVPTLASSSTKIQLAQVSTHTLTKHYNVATATSEIDPTYSVTHTNSLNKHSPPTVRHTVTEIHSERHNSTDGALLNSTVPVASFHTVGPFESVADNKASETVSKTQAIYDVTKSDVSMATSTDQGISMATANQPYVTPFADAPNGRSAGTETDQTSRSLRTTRAHQDISNQTHPSLFDDGNTISGIRAVTPNQIVQTLSHRDSTSHAEASGSPFLTSVTLAEHHSNTPYHTTQPSSTRNSLDLTSTQISHTIESEHTRPTIAQQSSLTLTSRASGFNNMLNYNTHHNAFPPFKSTTPSDLPPTLSTGTEALTEESRNSSPALTSHSPTTVRTDREKEISSTVFASSSIVPFVLKTTEVKPSKTPYQGTTEDAENNTSEQESTTTSFRDNNITQSKSPEKHLYTHQQQTTLLHTLSPTHITEINTAIPQSTYFPQTNRSGNDINHANSSQSSISLGPMIPVDISSSISIETRSIEATHSITTRPAWTVRNDPVTSTARSSVISFSSAISTAGEAVSISTSSQWDTRQTPVVNPPVKTTEWAKITPTLNSSHLPTTPVLQTHIPTQQPRSPTPRAQIITNSYQSQTRSHTPSTPAFTQTSWLHTFAVKTDRTDRDWSHKSRVFIVEDQPTIIKVETFQVLLQIVLQGNSTSHAGLVELELFLHRIAGYQSQQVTWHSGPVLQTVVTFRTVEARSWLGRVESLLQEAGLSPLPREGIFVGGVRVKNITVGGLHTDVCSWLFMCHSGFQCVLSEGNASCRSLCHSEYCKHQGICVHRHGQQPLCQCPVGEDFWFMGQRCDLRMTRQRLVGVCFGVLFAVAALMAVLSYLAVRRFKSMLIQAKVDQTRSSYRRFNHFDELSARFWGRSWPGSEDSLDNPAFTRSDELLHMRTLDRTCCYHDDTLSIASTYQDSVSHLNTVYRHSSQYRWDLSNYSLADCVVDSGKASDLSVCSWPIEPIQWTPFPLLHQLSRNTASVKASRPHSYCEGMELVDLEKSWTA